VTGPKFTYLHCSACGRVLGKSPGVAVSLGLLCEDPVCEYQGAPPDNIVRDSVIVAAALDGCGVTPLSFAADLSRQRVYQIVDRWKQGV
jgi:hypothetical protein